MIEHKLFIDYQVSDTGSSEPLVSSFYFVCLLKSSGTFIFTSNIFKIELYIVFYISDSDDQDEVAFGVLFNDDECANLFEAIVGTLRSAKKRKIVKYDGELLLQGVHDNVKITLLKTEL